MAPFLPAMTGIEGMYGFFGCAALAGGTAFISTAMLTGATSWATKDIYRPNWLAAGIAGGLAGLSAGIEGGMRASANNRYFWTGKFKPVNPVHHRELLQINLNVKLELPDNSPTMQSLYKDSDIYFINNTEIQICDNYYNGFSTMRSSLDSWSGGVIPKAETVKYGMTPQGPWEITDIDIDPCLEDPYVREDYGFKATLNNLFDLPSARQPGTFFFHPDGNVFGSNGCPVLQVHYPQLENTALFIQKYLSRYGLMRFTVIHY